MVLIGLLATVAALVGSPEGAAPSGAFARRAAPAVYAGRHAPLRFTGARSRRFRSALEDAYDGEVDFAGRYVLAEIGCGAGCVEVAALDARTGAVHWFPASVSDWPSAYPDPLEHRAESRLLIVHGRLGERGGEGPHVFVFDGRRFVPN